MTFVSRLARQRYEPGSLKLETEIGGLALASHSEVKYSYRLMRKHGQTIQVENASKLQHVDGMAFSGSAASP